MKLPPPTIVLFLFFPGPRGGLLSPVNAELCQRPQKNQLQWLASSSSSWASLAPPLFFFQRAQLSRSPRSLQLTIQTPSSL
jgi:hypothetical protein